MTTTCALFRLALRRADTFSASKRPQQKTEKELKYFAASAMYEGVRQLQRVASLFQFYRILVCDSVCRCSLDNVIAVCWRLGSVWWDASHSFSHLLQSCFSLSLQMRLVKLQAQLQHIIHGKYCYVALCVFKHEMSKLLRISSLSAA